MKRRNNLYTLSYFRKRLKDAGIYAKVLVDSYEEDDQRYWSIRIGKNHIITCTCYKFIEDGDEIVRFRLSDGNQKIVMDKYIQTESMNVIIEMLEKYL